MSQNTLELLMDRIHNQIQQCLDNEMDFSSKIENDVIPYCDSDILCCTVLFEYDILNRIM